MDKLPAGLIEMKKIPHNKIVKGIKFLDPALFTTYDGVTTSYIPALSGWMKHPEPAKWDGSDCGSGRWHVMSKCDSQYAPSIWYPWHAICRGVVGYSDEKFGCTEIQLKPIPKKTWWRYLRRFGKDANLTDANLRGANLTDANLTRSNLRGADLTDAYLRDANLRGANLTDANLRGASLTDANLSGVNLRGADLRNAYLRDANLSGVNLRGADLRNAYLRDANLRGANLTDANLRGANLTDANLSGVNLRGAYLSGADLSGADLSGAYLTNANLTGANLTRAKVCNHTLGLPDNIDGIVKVED